MSTQNNKSFKTNASLIHVSYPSYLPPPGVLADYEKVKPGLVDIILDLTKTQASHRQELENQKLLAEINHQKRRDCEAKLGQIFAFLIAITAILLGSYTAITGHEWAGSIIGASGIGGIIYTFIHGRKIN